jgi:type II secretory pathway pseudopilin PulG
MTASLSDLLSAAKNIAQAINDAARAYVGVQGSQVSNSVSASTQIVHGAGRLANINVIVAGTGAGVIYDTIDAGNSNNPNHRLAAIPMTVGSFFINTSFNDGLLVVPGTGQTVTVTYSTGSAAGNQSSASGNQARGR